MIHFIVPLESLAAMVTLSRRSLARMNRFVSRMATAD